MPTPTPWYYNVLDYGATGDEIPMTLKQFKKR
jgi:hypothetical protein